MAGTTSRGYRYPSNSDTPNIATDIQNLASDVNNDVTNKVGMFLVSTTTFNTNLSSVVIDSIFTSTYKHYKIIVDTVISALSTPSTCTVQLRSGGTTEATSGNYAWAGRYIYYSVSSITGVDEGQTDTSWKMPWNYGATSVTGQNASLILEIMQPQVANQTHFYARGIIPNQSSGGMMGMANYAGMHKANTSYDGIKFNLTSGVYTGTIKVYGFN